MICRCPKIETLYWDLLFFFFIKSHRIYTNRTFIYEYAKLFTLFHHPNLHQSISTPPYSQWLLSLLGSTSLLLTLPHLQAYNQSCRFAKSRRERERERESCIMFLNKCSTYFQTLSANPISMVTWSWESRLCLITPFYLASFFIYVLIIFRLRPIFLVVFFSVTADTEEH